MPPLQASIPWQWYAKGHDRFFVLIDLRSVLKKLAGGCVTSLYAYWFVIESLALYMPCFQFLRNPENQKFTEFKVFVYLVGVLWSEIPLLYISNNIKCERIPPVLYPGFNPRAPICDDYHGLG